MPIYSYICACGKSGDHVRSVASRDAGPICCGKRMRRIPVMPAVHFGPGCTRSLYETTKDHLSKKSHDQKQEWDRKCETGEITNEMIIHV